MAALYDLIFYKDELYRIDRKRKVNALDVPKYLSNNNIAMARRVVVPPREDVEPAVTEIRNYHVLNCYLWSNGNKLRPWLQDSHMYGASGGGGKAGRNG